MLLFCCVYDVNCEYVTIVPPPNLLSIYAAGLWAPVSLIFHTGGGTVSLGSSPSFTMNKLLSNKSTKLDDMSLFSAWVEDLNHLVFVFFSLCFSLHPPLLLGSSAFLQR